MIISKKAAVVAFGFGEPATLRHNREFAIQAVDVAHKMSAVCLYTDRDLFVNLPESRVKVEQLDPTLFPNTILLAEFAIRQAKELGIDTLYVMAAECHIPRCMDDLRWMAKEQGVEIKLVSRPFTGNPYDWTSTTWFTRSPWFWWPMETIYRVFRALRPKRYLQRARSQKPE